MADVATQSSPGRSGRSTPDPRQVRRRRSLPGSRAVVGGFLVAAAAVGTFGAYTSATAGPSDTYVVLTRDVSAGERLTSSDLALVTADLPDAQRATVLSDLGVATGATAVSPLQAGQLLAASDVVKLAGVVGRAQLSIPVEPARANNGQLTRGERVDVIATTTSAGDALTETIAFDAVVVRVFTGDQSLGSSNSVVVTLSLAADELESVADASAGATITLARVSGLDRDRSSQDVVGGLGGEEPEAPGAGAPTTSAPVTTTPPSTAPTTTAAPAGPAPAPAPGG